MLHIGIDLRPLLTPVKTGVGEYTFELLNALFLLDSSNQYYLFYNATTSSPGLPAWQQDNLHWIGSGWPNKIFNASLALGGVPRLDRLITKRLKKGVQKLDWFFSPNFGFTALSNKTKSILTVHDLSFEFFPNFFSPRQRLWHRVIRPKRQCQRADLIITPSTNTKRDLIDYYRLKPEKITVIYPGLSSVFTPGSRPDTEAIKKKYNLPAKFILFIGTVEPRKNVGGLLRAFEQLATVNPEQHLIIAGAPGYRYQKIEQQIKKSKIKDRLRYMNYVATADKPGLYALAELFVYPSFYEGFGFPVLEALASGIPVITSNRSSLSEITQNKAYLINPNKPHEITEAMLRILQNNELKNRLITGGLEQSKQFTWDKAAQQFLNLLNV